MAFGRFCAALDERYPSAFSIVATRGGSDATPTTDRRDLITLPKGRELWPDPDMAAARMLVAYAKQFSPRATVFTGGDASDLHSACQRVISSGAALGEQVVIPSMDTPPVTLFQTLDRALPASLAVSPTTEDEPLSAELARHSGTGVALYWRGKPSSRILELLSLAKQHARGPISLQLTLHDVTKNRRASLDLMGKLLMKNPDVRVSVVADDGIYRFAGRAVTFMFTALHRRGAR